MASIPLESQIGKFKLKKEGVNIAEVIHTINGKRYLYEHTRKGDKVECTYLHPCDDEGNRRSGNLSERLPEKFEKKELTCKNCGNTITVNNQSGNKKYYCLCGSEIRNESKVSSEMKQEIKQEVS